MVSPEEVITVSSDVKTGAGTDLELISITVPAGKAIFVIRYALEGTAAVWFDVFGEKRYLASAGSLNERGSLNEPLIKRGPFSSDTTLKVVALSAPSDQKFAASVSVVIR